MPPPKPGTAFVPIRRRLAFASAIASSATDVKAGWKPIQLDRFTVVKLINESERDDMQWARKDEPSKQEEDSYVTLPAGGREVLVGPEVPEKLYVRFAFGAEADADLVILATESHDPQMMAAIAAAGAGSARLVADIQIQDAEDNIQADVISGDDGVKRLQTDARLTSTGITLIIDAVSGDTFLQAMNQSQASFVSSGVVVSGNVVRQFNPIAGDEIVAVGIQDFVAVQVKATGASSNASGKIGFFMHMSADGTHEDTNESNMVELPLYVNGAVQANQTYTLDARGMASLAWVHVRNNLPDGVHISGVTAFVGLNR